MSKKFDVVIGNPPYQEEAAGEATHDMPVYHQFMDAAYEVGKKAVLITPARFLFNAGYTPKAWNEKMLADEHLTVRVLRAQLERPVPGLRTPSRAASPSPTGTRAQARADRHSSRKHPELNTILHKVAESAGRSLNDVGITNDRQYRVHRQDARRAPRRAGLMSEGNAVQLDSNAFDRLRVPVPRGDAPDDARVR